MDKNFYFFVGKAGQQEQGFALYRYSEENGQPELLRDGKERIKTGAHFFCKDRHLFYLTDEIAGPAGGYAVAYRFDTEGRLQKLSDECTHANLPAYCWLDKTGKYLFVAHHATEKETVKTSFADGCLSSLRRQDSAALEVFSIKENGSIGPCIQMLDYSSLKSREGCRFSHIHSVMEDPSGRFLVATDKGKSSLYTLTLSKGNKAAAEKDTEGLLRESDCVQHPVLYRTRYTAFHPTKNYLYCNGEDSFDIYGYSYTPEGKLTEICCCSAMTEPDIEKARASEIRIHPNGKNLYAAYRSNKTIAVMKINTDGSLLPIQTISCGGENPRGLCLSPDGRFVFVANMDSNQILRFHTQADGSLVKDDFSLSVAGPANIGIY